MNESKGSTDSNALIQEHLKHWRKAVQGFCLLAIEKAQLLPIPDVVEILRTSAKDYLADEGDE